MTSIRNVGWMVAGSALLTLAGCATTGGSLASSAERLERNAAAYAVDARDERFDSDSRYSSATAADARELADDAREFRIAVKDDRADSDDVEDAFERLSRSYHDLRDEVDRSDSREARNDLEPLTQAYLDIEREMRADSRRHARDDDDDDRRYR